MSFQKNIYKIFTEEEIYFIAKYVEVINSKSEIVSEIDAFNFSLVPELPIEKEVIKQKLLTIRKDDYIDLISYVESLRSITV